MCGIQFIFEFKNKFKYKISISIIMYGMIKAIYEYNAKSGKNEVIGFENFHNYGTIEFIKNDGTDGTISGCLEYLKDKFKKMVESGNYCYCVLFRARTIDTPRYKNHDMFMIDCFDA